MYCDHCTYLCNQGNPGLYLASLSFVRKSIHGDHMMSGDLAAYPMLGAFLVSDTINHHTYHCK